MLLLNLEATHIFTWDKTWIYNKQWHANRTCGYEVVQSVKSDNHSVCFSWSSTSHWVKHFINLQFQYFQTVFFFLQFTCRKLLRLNAKITILIEAMWTVANVYRVTFVLRKYAINIHRDEILISFSKGGYTPFFTVDE